jgi:hypothetical protein
MVDTTEVNLHQIVSTCPHIDSPASSLVLGWGSLRYRCSVDKSRSDTGQLFLHSPRRTSLPEGRIVMYSMMLSLDRLACLDQSKI